MSEYSSGRGGDIPDPSNERWQPNGTSFWDGQPHVRGIQQELGFNPETDFLTSKDEIGARLQERLETDNVPSRFRKWQLPFSFYEPSNVYITEGEPGASVAEHAHTEGAGYRLVLNGSLTVDGKVLRQGDWMWVPKGHPYSYEVGEEGVLLAAGYQC
jgi:hypothetical protein